MEKYLKKINIIEDKISDSTLDLLCGLDMKEPKTYQYILYKCFIFEFVLNTVNNMQFHYVLNRMSFYNKDKEVTDENIENCFNRGTLLDIYTNSLVVKYAAYEEDDWYLKL